MQIKIVNNLFKSYINILTSKLKIYLNVGRVRNNRFSANRIYISRAEMKHTNAKVILHYMRIINKNIFSTVK